MEKHDPYRRRYHHLLFVFNFGFLSFLFWLFEHLFLILGAMMIFDDIWSRDGIPTITQEEKYTL